MQSFLPKLQKRGLDLNLRIKKRRRYKKIVEKAIFLYNRPIAMKLLLRYLKQNKKVLILALLITTFQQVFSLADPQIFRLMLDNYVVKVFELSAQEFFEGIIILLLISMGIAFGARISKHMQNYYVNVVTQRVGARLYAHSIGHSFSLPFSVFEDQRSGELLEKLQRARLDAQVLIEAFINIIFLLLIGIIVVVGYGFTVHWLIGASYLLVIPVIAATSFFITKRIKGAQKQIVAESAALAGSTTETMRNVELVKSLGLEEQEIARLNTANEQILQLELKKVRLVRTLGFVQDTVLNVLRSGILLLLFWLIFKGVVSVGEFFTLFIYSFFIFNPLSDIGKVSAQYQDAQASMEQLQDILDIQPESKPENPVMIDSVRSFSFQDVDFAYKSNNTLSLRSIQLDIQSGQTIAFVGPSGSGKTTLVKILLGLYRPTKGKLLINGIDTATIDYDHLRKRIGYVSQETQLFGGTIRENLLFVNPDASDRECMEALRQSAALTIVERGGKGLDTKIGEGGIKLSGGERQRLAIARALLRNPGVIIFDEATSSLDSITENAIAKTIRDIVSARPNLITIIIAHRLSTVAAADLIYVLENGKIIEQGKHHELLQKRGLYAALWREQSGGIDKL